MPTTYGDISPRMAGYVMKKLLERGLPDLVFDKFGMVSELEFTEVGEEMCFTEAEADLAEMEGVWDEYPWPETEFADWQVYSRGVTLNENWMSRVEVACTSTK